jgi:F0F1-type ATP synthase membrane subunit b/b'
LTEHNKKLQEDLNNALANQENLEREVNTQKEIMKQMEVNRKEYIQKLKKELETVEERFQVKVEQMEMVG